MENSIRSRIKHAWNAFRDNNSFRYYQQTGNGSSYRPDRVRMTRGNSQSIVTPIYNRIALDVSSVDKSDRSHVVL